MSEPKSLRELQVAWKAYVKGVGDYDEGWLSSRQNCADALSPHIEREERQSAYIKQLEAVAKAAEGLLAKHVPARWKKLRQAVEALSRLSADNGEKL